MVSGDYDGQTIPAYFIIKEYAEYVNQVSIIQRITFGTRYKYMIEICCKALLSSFLVFHQCVIVYIMMLRDVMTQIDEFWNCRINCCMFMILMLYSRFLM